MRKLLLIILSFVFTNSNFSQQLMINEVSQGTGVAEYVEFVVVGSPICEGEEIPCIDIRGVVFDDNNGLFQLDSTNMTGIAQGALRFSKADFWSCIPQGTFIVIYNEESRNSSIPPDDNSLTDGNCRLILPGNSNLLESTNVSPFAGNPTYPTDDSDWTPSTGWNAGGAVGGGIAMRNAGDSFFIPILSEAGSTGAALHSVSWGNNEDNTIIYFSGSAAGLVMNFKNVVSNDWNDQANWVAEAVATGQTPGAPNSVENDLWIATMNPTCRVNPALTFSVKDESCAGNDGNISVVVNGTTNFTILWDNGETTPGISNLVAGNYSVEVTDLNTGCVYIGSVDVAKDDGGMVILSSSVDESCTNLCDGTVSYSVSGGQTPYTITWSQNGLPITEPTSFCAGTYSINVTDANTCEVSEDIIISTTSTLNYNLSNDTTICLGDSIDIFIQDLSLVGLPATILWSTGESSESINIAPSQNTNFSVVFTKDNCIVNEEVQIEVIDCNFDIEITFPNIFTPNNDDVNDFYIPLSFSGVKNIDFVILNRWGNVVYESKTQEIKWDGKVDGKEASEGVYFYKINYLEGNSTEQKSLHGFLHLERK
jgi:gliding motility-associated-like protein